MIEVEIIKEKKQWEDFALSQEYTLFTQSWKYGEFFKTMGEEYWIYGIFDDEKLIGGSLVVTVHAKRGNFLFLPYGPIVSGDANLHGVLPMLFKKIKEYAKAENYDFIRVSPFLDNTKENKQVFKKGGFRDAPMHILAEYTWILDLSPSEEILLRNMEKNHRNLIRRCQKEGVMVKKSKEAGATEQFNKLHDYTAERHNFHRFSDEYVAKEFNSFTLDNEACIFNGFLKNGVLDSSAIIMYYGKMGAYRHGASLLTDKRIPTSYLLQWEAILEAKRRGLRWYNFWGIAPEGAPKSHPFYGISHFKKGFGGQPKLLINCQDLPVSKRYWINWIIEVFRSLKRGFK